MAYGTSIIIIVFRSGAWKSIKKENSQSFENWRESPLLKQRPWPIFGSRWGSILMSHYSWLITKIESNIHCAVHQAPTSSSFRYCCRFHAQLYDVSSRPTKIMRSNVYAHDKKKISAAFYQITFDLNIWSRSNLCK